ncbi:MAG: hypothetical protein M1541_18575, partial [Acidobacteria bacterium]|nr:hypothetical protein [Acidobacteriota bacterium]
MDPAFVVRFRPQGPWRIGPDSGARNQLDRIYHSDTLFSAVSHAMAQLGMLPEWLAGTAGNPEGPAVRFSSCFPFLDDLLFVTPPRTLWPPPLSPKIRWKSARFVPFSAVSRLMAEEPLGEDRWTTDGLSECLLPHNGRHRSGPFRPTARSYAAVDRLSGSVEVHSAACLEFSEGGGLWAAAAFASEAAKERWSDPVKAAFRVLADTGLGGRKSLGWGHSLPPEFQDGIFPDMLVGQIGAPGLGILDEGTTEMAYWLLSMFAPAAEEGIDWQRGSYSLAARGGRIDSPARSGEPKKLVRMVEEGSVLISSKPPRGA